VRKFIVILLLSVFVFVNNGYSGSLSDKLLTTIIDEEKEIKKEEIKKEEFKKEEPKKEEIKINAKKEELKKEEPKKEENKIDIKNEEPKKEQIKADTKKEKELPQFKDNVSTTVVTEQKQTSFPDQKTAELDKKDKNYPLVSISSFGRRLGDIVIDISSQTGYNIVFGPETDPNVNVVINVNNVPLDKAIDIITQYLNYGYEIEGNTITISKMISKTFTIPEVAINIPQTTAELGGDMLGGSSSSSGTTGYTGIGGTSTDTGSQSLKASVSIKKADDKLSGREIFEDNIKKFLSPDGHYIIDWLSATLFVYDSPRNIRLIENYLKNLRKEADKQLLVESTISIVTLKDETQLGIDWNIIAKRLGGEILTDSSRGRNFTISTNLSGNVTNPAITITRTASDVSAVLKALQEQGNVKIISSPYVYARNLQPVAIYSGKSVPYISSIQRTVTGQTNESTTSYSISRAQDGAMLSIKAHIRDDGKIDLQIVPILASIDGFVNFNIDNNSFSNPISSIQQTLQSITVKDGDTIVIGGIKKDKKSETTQGVPFLSKIPILGALFSYTDKESENAEIVIAIKVKKIEI